MTAPIRDLPADAAPNLVPEALDPLTLGFILRRTALALTILTIGVGTLAWLTHASLEPEHPATQAGTRAAPAASQHLVADF